MIAQLLTMIVEMVQYISGKSKIISALISTKEISDNDLFKHLVSLRTNLLLFSKVETTKMLKNEFSDLFPTDRKQRVLITNLEKQLSMSQWQLLTTALHIEQPLNTNQKLQLLLKMIVGYQITADFEKAYNDKIFGNLFAEINTELEKQEKAVLTCLIKHQKVESSNITSIGYSDQYHVIEVKFHSNVKYRYFYVEKTIFDNFVKSQSKGQFFHKHIKTNYTCKKIVK